MTAIPLSRLDRNESFPLLPTARASHRHNNLDSLINSVADAIFQIVVATAAGLVAAKAFTRSSDLEQGAEVGAGVGFAFYCIQQFYHCASQNKETSSSRVIRVITTLAVVLFVYPIVVGFNEEIKGRNNSTDSDDYSPIFGFG